MKTIKVYVDKDELYPDYSDMTGNYSEELLARPAWQQKYLTEVPEVLWKDYLSVRKAYLALRDELSDWFHEQGKTW